MNILMIYNEWEFPPSPDNDPLTHQYAAEVKDVDDRCVVLRVEDDYDAQSIAQLLVKSGAVVAWKELETGSKTQE